MIAVEDQAIFIDFFFIKFHSNFRAGLVQFDVIVGINGKSINTAKEIYSIVEKLPFDGDLAPLTIDIIRRGKRLQVIVKPEVIEPYH